MKIIFEFIGGSRDGQFDEGDLDEPDYGSVNMACARYSMTKNGTVGKQFFIATQHAISLLQTVGAEAARESGNSRAEKYEVVERMEGEGEVLVRAKFVGYVK